MIDSIGDKTTVVADWLPVSMDDDRCMMVVQERSLCLLCPLEL